MQLAGTCRQKSLVLRPLEVSRVAAQFQEVLLAFFRVKIKYLARLLYVHQA